MEKLYDLTVTTKTGYRAWVTVTAESEKEARKKAFEIAEDLEEEEKSH